jgi:hypothetical protein
MRRPHNYLSPQNPWPVRYGSSESTLLSNLKAYWKLGESSGNAADSSGNGLTLTNNNATYVAGKVGNAVDFVAANSAYLSVSNTAFATNGKPWSIAFWCKSNAAGLKGVFSLYADKRLWCYVTGNEFNLSMDGGGGLLTNTRWARSVSDATTWNHIVFLWSGTEVSAIYLNGDSGAMSSTTGYSTPTATSTDLGRGLSAIFSTINLDEFGLWDRALTSSEIAELYNSGTGKTYPF